MSLEGTALKETQGNEVHDIPGSHMEGMDLQPLREMRPEQAALEVGKHYFSEEVQSSPGVLKGFQKLEADADADKFAEHYSNYMNKPNLMHMDNPKMYEFMRDRIFSGKEYKTQTHSNAFGMVFPYNAAESRELRARSMLAETEKN